MESNGNNSNNPHENHPSEFSTNDASKDSSTEKVVFVNHAEIAWHEGRKQWVGDQPRRTRRLAREPVMSWTTTYEDILCSTDPFHQPIPLAEMVDFLVDIWHEEGLYD